VPALAAIAIIGLYLAPPSAASAAQPPAAVPAATPTAGTALAWGDNTFGELGNGTTGGISSVPVPVDLPAGTSVTAVAASRLFNLALTSTGSVLAWGANFDGQLGDHTTTNSSTPVTVDLPAGTHVTAIAAGDDFSLALTSAGSILAWGDDYWGELGNGGGGDQLTPVTVDLPAGTRVTAIAAGGDDGLALTSTGSVLAWGRDDYGQLGGGGSTARDSTPIRVDLPAGTRVADVAAGELGGLALTSAGRVLAWGDNTFGELGNGTTGGISSTPVPVDLPAGTAVTAIAAGEGHALALTSVGRVLTWGDNEFGQLGIGTITGGSPVPVPVDLPAGIRVTAVAGSQSSLALTSTGTVLAWGDNDYGELGDRGTANSPVPVSVDLPAGTSVTAISAGLKNSLAVTVHTSC
jgi:alpha-tubulin suppressor-like RCC1 family protein